MSIQTPEQVLQQATDALWELRAAAQRAGLEDSFNTVRRFIERASLPAAAPDLLEAVDTLLETAPCECSDKRRYEKGEHLSGCYLFDLNIARSGLPAAAVPTQLLSRSHAWGMYEKQGSWTPSQLAALGRLPDGLYELRSPPLTSDQIRAAFACPAPAAASSTLPSAPAAELTAADIKAINDVANEYESLSKRWREARAYSQEVANLHATYKAREHTLGKLAEGGLFRRLAAMLALAPTGGEAEQLQTELTDEQIIAALVESGLPVQYVNNATTRRDVCMTEGSVRIERIVAGVRAVLSHLAASQSVRTSGEALGTVPSAQGLGATLDHAYAEGRKDEREALGEEAPCPHCDGSGTVTAYTNEGPDGERIEVDCDHCGGKQTLLDAYRGVVKLLARKHEQYIDLCGQVAFQSHPSHKQSFKDGWLDCRRTMARFVEPNDATIAMSIRANWKPSLGDDPERRPEAQPTATGAASPEVLPASPDVQDPSRVSEGKQ